MNGLVYFFFGVIFAILTLAGLEMAGKSADRSDLKSAIGWSVFTLVVIGLTMLCLLTSVFDGASR